MSIKSLVSTGRGKMIVAACVVVLAAAAMLGAAQLSHSAAVADAVPSSSAPDISSMPFAAAPAVSVPETQNSAASSNPLSVVVGLPHSSSSSSLAMVSHATSSAVTSKPIIRTPIKMMPTEKSSSVPQAAPPTTTTSKPNTSTISPSDPYAEYTSLDMTDLKVGPDNYYLDAENSIAARFENKVNPGCNLPRDRMGSTVIDLQGPTQLYADGEVTLDELRSVLLNGKKYIGGGSDKYVVTGVYDNSGITYDRNISTIDSNPDSVINGIYAKGFVNNPYAGTTSYCDGYMCVKVSDGGSKATIGYVRALIFTLKKIS